MTVRALAQVNLRVRHLAESAAFYRDLFGLRPRQSDLRSAKSCLCVGSNGGDAVEAFGVFLTESLQPASGRSVDHFSFEVPAVRDVFETYINARARGTDATAPRFYHGHWQTFVFDPDGYKIEVFTRDLSDLARAAVRPPTGLLERS